MNYKGNKLARAGLLNDVIKWKMLGISHRGIVKKLQNEYEIKIALSHLNSIFKQQKCRIEKAENKDYVVKARANLDAMITKALEEEWG